MHHIRPMTTMLIATALAAAGCAAGEDPASATTASAVTVTGPLTLTMAPSVPLVQGTPTPYEVTVTNTTANTVTIFSLTLDFTGAQVNQVPTGCARLGGGGPDLSCAAGSIAPGATLTFDTQVRVDTAGTVTFQAAWLGNGAGLAFATDVESVAAAPTDVQVTGSSNNGSPPLGSAFTYTFQVKNNGPFATFGGVSFTDNLPASLTFNSVSTNIGSCTGGASVSCSLGDLAVGTQATIQISTQAPSAAQTIVNTATVAIGQQPDRNPANNSVSVTVTPK